MQIENSSNIVYILYRLIPKLFEFFFIFIFIKSFFLLTIVKNRFI